MIKLDLSHVIEKIDFTAYQEKVNAINQMIDERTGPGSDFLGWTTWPNDYDKEEVAQIKRDASYVRQNFEVLVVCGIGGSYLGARSAIDALRGLYSSAKPEIIYLGQTFSSTYIHQVLTYLKTKKFAINVISKSGTTTETSVAFRLVKELLEQKVGKNEARKAIFATTDKARGALKTLADKEGYQTYVLPDNIGGRYSVITAVGLFPIACAGFDIDELLLGAKDAAQDFSNPNLKSNVAYQYAVTRDYLYHHHYQVEMFVLYEPQYTQIGEWCKQLFGESEGKEGKGLLPDSATFSTDLHSLGQFIQEGTHLLFETVIHVDSSTYEVKVPHDEDNLDGLNYLEGKTLTFINDKAFEGTVAAHEQEGKVPNIIINLPKIDSYNIGYMFFFFMKTCAMSAYLLDINPFNQPGVEIYKRNMFHLLGKKGY